eukprot:403367294
MIGSIGRTEEGAVETSSPKSGFDKRKSQSQIRLFGSLLNNNETSQKSDSLFTEQRTQKVSEITQDKKSTSLSLQVPKKSMTRKQKLEKVMSQAKDDDRNNLDLHNPTLLTDSPMINFNEHQNPWKTLFLGLVSVSASKYQSYMLTKLKKIQQEQKMDVKKKGSQLSQNEGISPDNPSAKKSIETPSSYISQLKLTQNNSESPKTFQLRKQRLQQNNQPGQHQSSQQIGRLMSQDSFKTDQLVQRPNLQPAVTQLNLANLKKLDAKNIPLQRVDSFMSNGGGSKRGSGRSHLSRRSSRFGTQSTINERKIKLIMKGGRLVNPSRSPSLLKRTGIQLNNNQLMKNFAPKNLTDWKREILNNQILNGMMSSKAIIYLQNMLRTKDIDRSLQFHNGATVNKKKYNKVIKNSASHTIFNSQKKNHERLVLDKLTQFTNLEKFDILTEMWNDLEDKDYQIKEPQEERQFLKKSKSMIDLDFMDKYQHKYEFNYVKSKWKTYFSEMFDANLKQVIRRKSCYCSHCGITSEKHDRIARNELMTEPVYPFIKSKEEIEYEKRIQQRKTNIKQIKRMKLDQFKQSLRGHFMNEGSKDFDQLSNESEDVTQFEKNDNQSMDMMKFQSSIDRLKRNSQMIRNSSTAVRAIQDSINLTKINFQSFRSNSITQTPTDQLEQEKQTQQSVDQAQTTIQQQGQQRLSIIKLQPTRQFDQGPQLMSPLLRGKKQSLRPNQIFDLQQIKEEQDDCYLPLYRSVKIKGSKERISSIIRNPKTLETLINKAQTIRNFQMLQQNTDEMIERVFKQKPIVIQEEDEKSKAKQSDYKLSNILMNGIKDRLSRKISLKMKQISDSSNFDSQESSQSSQSSKTSESKESIASSVISQSELDDEYKDSQLSQGESESNSDEEDSSSKGSSLHTSIQSIELDPEYVQQQIKLQEERRRLRAQERRNRQIMLSCAMKIDKRQLKKIDMLLKEKRSKVVMEKYSQQLSPKITVTIPEMKRTNQVLTFDQKRMSQSSQFSINSQPIRKCETSQQKIRSIYIRKSVDSDDQPKRILDLRYQSQQKQRSGPSLFAQQEATRLSTQQSQTNKYLEMKRKGLQSQCQTTNFSSTAKSTKNTIFKNYTQFPNNRYPQTTKNQNTTQVKGSFTSSILNNQGNSNHLLNSQNFKTFQNFKKTPTPQKGLLTGSWNQFSKLPQSINDFKVSFTDMNSPQNNNGMTRNSQISDNSSIQFSMKKQSFDQGLKKAINVYQQQNQSHRNIKEVIKKHQNNQSQNYNQYPLALPQQ